MKPSTSSFVVATVAVLGAVAGGASGASAQLRDPGASPGKAAAFSALLPGAGQYVLDQNRSWAYLAAEAVGWAFYVDRRSSAIDFRTGYRDLAWREARLQAAQRVEGDFEYYERMTKWRTSGAYDADPGTPGVQPETDPATFNGDAWGLASQIFLPEGTAIPESDPRYQRALEYYQGRAYGPEFLWDWTGKEAEQEEFGGLIRRSDDRFRQATNILGLVFANHVVSAVDAYLSARAPRTSIQSGFVRTPAGFGWTARLDVSVPW